MQVSSIKERRRDVGGILGWKMDREQKAQRYETIWEHHKRNSIGEKGKKKKKKERRRKEFQRREE